MWKSLLKPETHYELTRTWTEAFFLNFITVLFVTECVTGYENHSQESERYDERRNVGRILCMYSVLEQLSFSSSFILPLYD